MEVIAINITNLTDARYFAARGVSWLVYPVKSKMDAARVLQVKEWVEGPLTAIALDEALEEKEEFIQMIQPDALWNPTNDILIRMETFEPDQTLHVWQHNKTLKKYVMLTSWSSEQINKIATDPKLSGIIISGKDEQEVGLREYEDLDDLLDLIEDLTG